LKEISSFFFPYSKKIFGALVCFRIASHLIDHLTDLQVLVTPRARVPQLLLEVVNLLLVLLEHRLVVKVLVHHALGRDALGPGLGFRV
jgi:hypothetical protein